MWPASTRSGAAVWRDLSSRPRSLSFQQTEQESEPLGPTQDQLIPSQRGGGISLQEASAKAQSAFPGTVVGAREVQMGDRVVY